MPKSDEPSRPPAELLAGHPFVEGMEEAQALWVANCVTGVAQFQPDEVIFRAGGTARSLYLVRRGDVALEIYAPGAGVRIIQTLHGGDLLGWSWMFPPYRWQFDARALSPTEAVIIDGVSLRECVTRDHELGFHVMWRLAREVVDRLQAARLQLLDLYTDRA